MKGAKYLLHSAIDGYFIYGNTPSPKRKNSWFERSETR
jgi:hypothetical protein